MNEQKRTIQRKNEEMRCNENMKACEQRRSVEVWTPPSNPTIRHILPLITLRLIRRLLTSPPLNFS